LLHKRTHCAALESTDNKTMPINLLAGHSYKQRSRDSMPGINNRIRDNLCGPGRMLVNQCVQNIA
jgi:hypothetical protein